MRVERLISSMDDADLDAYVVTRGPNIYYYTGTISGGIFIVSAGSEPLLLTPRLNLAIAHAQASGIEVRPFARDDLPNQIGEALKQAQPRTVGFDDLALNLYLKLQDKFKDIELRASSDVVWDMRRVKDSTEQKLMRRAGELADMGMEAVRERLGEGVREYEVAAEAVYAMMKNGAEGMAFEIIVASGPRSAYPHAGVTDRRIGDGDFVTVDLGATYKEYRSDLTRTFIVGEPSEKQSEIYRAVLGANEAALPEIRAGAKGREVDGVARALIVGAGYGE
ncbi:MAG: Xaa-Pro peptidase family protein, partial [Candidatus Bathyarchaeota archaeon]|nr:Xaa-Pro peptidase family protein [Candidatus Bathyarchaeota archaeon]